MTMPSRPGLDPAKQRRMALSAVICVAVVAGMGGLAFAAVPLYQLFCQVTGFGGTTQVAQAAPSAVLDRTIQVRFDTNVANGLPLELVPPAAPSIVHLGETALVFFTVRNTSERPVVTVASYNVTPHKTGKYFSKMQCFCFQEQVIQPGESKAFPVIFYVAPELADDLNTEEVQAVTLSYTMHRSMDDAAEQIMDASSGEEIARLAAPGVLAGGGG